MATTQYDQIIPTHVLLAHFRFLLEGVRARQDEAVAEEMYRLQGEARLLKKLANTAETLTLIEEAREAEEKEKGAKPQHAA